MKKSQLERLLFIEKRLFWYGKIQRKEIQDQFGVSPRVSTNDFAKYHELAPDNATWDRPSYGYIATDEFCPAIIEPKSSEVLEEIFASSGPLSGSVSVATLNVPGRTIPVEVLRALLNAIYCAKSITIYYRSMSRPEPTWRKITPHGFAHDGFRFHVRAFCAKRGRFIDFVIGRIVDTGEIDAPDATSEQDDEWNETVDITIGPDPRLNSNQRAAIEMDYGMIDGKATFSVRKSMLFYALKQLCLNRNTGAKAIEQQITLLNKEKLGKYVNFED